MALSHVQTQSDIIAHKNVPIFSQFFLTEETNNFHISKSSLRKISDHNVLVP